MDLAELVRQATALLERYGNQKVVGALRGADYGIYSLEMNYDDHPQVVVIDLDSEVSRG